MKTCLIRVFGIVQGVGFRPFISRLADRCGIKGSVCNKGSYVEIQAQGSATALQDFQHALPHEAPPRSTILKLDVVETECQPYDDFQIIESTKEKGDIFVSPDIAVCDECKKELFDKHNRRYLHPFINCTACGPRLTILDSMPYDRERTSMGEFPMCPDCHYEYTHADTRRYDAQPVCCNDCGPEVYLLGRSERRHEAITESRRIIATGGIVAVKGIGGFHLCCDGTNESAVMRLRSLKKRPIKPFAVMMRDMETVRRQCIVEDGQDEVLDGHQKPIVLLHKRSDTHLCQAIAPGNSRVGVMLPYAPLQLLLFTYDDEITMPDSLVMTSANDSGAPICRTDEDALKELSTLCDIILSHNRTIRLRADDSVMDWYDGGPYMIRRSRGYAPLPFFVGEYTGSVLAVGGELKNTFCVSKNNLFYLSPYVGDMADIRTIEAWRQSAERMKTLLEADPTVIVCDKHPRYNTVAVAHEMGLPVMEIQHHYAHVLSCMAENNYLKPLIGVSFDGTGYGDDGTIWGGEIFTAHTHGYSRRASIMPFQQLGGDASAKEGWRIAVSMIYSLTACDREETAHIVRALQLCDDMNLAAQRFMYDNHINSVVSTSAGRLFDAVSALLGFCRISTFEGDAAMRLQFAAEEWEELHGALPVEPSAPKQGERWLLPTDQLVMKLVRQYLDGTPPAELAYEFHVALAGMIAGAVMGLGKKENLTVAALSGGVFQNRLLLRLTDTILQDQGFTVLRHHLVPPNDGGIALGQALWAAANSRDKL